MTLALEQLSVFDLGLDRGGDVHRYAAHSYWTTLVANNDRIRLYPYLVPVFMQQAKTARAALSGSIDGCCFSRHTLTVFRMNNSETETWRSQPFFCAISEHLLDVTTDKVNSALGCAGLSPSFPNDTGNMLDDVFDATALKLQLRSEF